MCCCRQNIKFFSYFNSIIHKRLWQFLFFIFFILLYFPWLKYVWRLDLLNVALNNTKNINNVSFGSSNRSEKFKLYDATTGGYIEVERTKQSAKDKFESRLKEEEKRQRLERRRQREIQRKKAFRRKVDADLAVVSTFGTMICYALNDTNKTKTLVETPVIV